MKKVGPSATTQAKGPIEQDQFDVKGLAELTAMKARVSARWYMGTNDLLSEKNVELLGKIKSLETRVDSMLRIPVKPKDLQKRWDELLNEYERTLNQAIAYASRHLGITVAS